MFRCGSDDLLGQSIDSFVPERLRATHRGHRTGYLINASPRPMGENIIGLCGLRKDGSEFPADVSLCTLETENGPLVLAAIRDLTERRRLEEQLAHAGDRDPLTGLLSRHRFEEAAEWQIAQTPRDDGEGTILMVGLDNFRDINNSLGHKVGDEILRRIVRQLVTCVHRTDIAGRLGGDEFGTILSDGGPRRDSSTAEAITNGLREHDLTMNGRHVAISASIGIAYVPDHAKTVEALICCVDLAMYQAKETGRNRTVVYSSDNNLKARLESRVATRNLTRIALEEDHLLLYAQPILDLHKNKAVQHELLLRVADGHMIISPGDFVKTAEQSGLIQDTDRWLVRHAIRLIARHRTDGYEPRLSVNISALALEDSALQSIIRRELMVSGVDPSSLVLEITETAAMANIEASREFMLSLKRFGCRFALDDFGVGYSSLSVPKRLPVDYLKLDGSYVRTVAKSTADQHLVRAIVDVASGLGKQTVAEWVEDWEAIQRLRELGVDFAQGFYVGRPEEANRVLAIKRLEENTAA